MRNNKILFIYGIILIILLSIGKTFKNNSIEKTIYNLLIKSGIPSPLSLLIVAQAKHETAKGGIPFTSYSYFTRNNLFGYGYVKNNPLQSGNGGKHPEDGGYYAKYASIENSILDIVGWYKRRKTIFYPINNETDFAQALKNSSYYTGPQSGYTSGLKKFYKSNLT